MQYFGVDFNPLSSSIDFIRLKYCCVLSNAALEIVRKIIGMDERNHLPPLELDAQHSKDGNPSRWPCDDAKCLLPFASTETTIHTYARYEHPIGIFERRASMPRIMCIF